MASHPRSVKTAGAAKSQIRISPDAQAVSAGLFCAKAGIFWHGGEGTSLGLVSRPEDRQLIEALLSSPDRKLRDLTRTVGLSDSIARQFAESALALRYGRPELAPIRAEQLLEIRRRESRGNAHPLRTASRRVCLARGIAAGQLATIPKVTVDSSIRDPVSGPPRPTPAAPHPAIQSSRPAWRCNHAPRRGSPPARTPTHHHTSTGPTSGSQDMPRGYP